MSDESRLPGCFKFGCFGCLALVALFVGLILLVGAIQVTFEPEDPSPVERQTTHDLPEPPDLPLGGDPGEDRPEVGEVLPLPEDIDLGGAPRGGTLVLDLRMGEFILRPGPADEPIRIDADYDENSFELVENFSDGEDGWRYEVSFGGKGGFFGLLMRGGGEGSRNRVEITIPRGHPVEIIGEIGMGESESDLGGLWVRRVDLQYGAGDHFLEFREPLPVPMEEFLVDSSMGSFEVSGLGEASPRRVQVDHGMGELLVDLKGTWRQDSEIDVDFSMGACRLWLPKNARIDIDRANVSMGEKRMSLPDESELPPDAPLLTLRLSGSMGELRVED